MVPCTAHVGGCAGVPWLICCWRVGGMAGFIWYTNHRMWRGVPPFAGSREVLKAYIVDASAYVYWSTPRHQDEIRAGDAAYIFRTADEHGEDGIVACGRVEETPRNLTHATLDLFAFPDRLAPAGWDEEIAPSSRKTGIRIVQTFWEKPVNPGLRPASGAMGRLSEDECKAVEAEIAKR